MSERKSFDAAPGRPGENAIRIFVEEYDSFSDDYSMVEHCITVDRAREIISGIQAAIKAAEPVTPYVSRYIVESNKLIAKCGNCAYYDANSMYGHVCKKTGKPLSDSDYRYGCDQFKRFG